jgi:hypothetical protein
MTDIAYEKGALFLRHLEETMGREAMDRFLRSYFDRFAFQSMTTERFVAALQEQLGAEDPAVLASLNMEGWIYQPGLPPQRPEPQSVALAQVEGQLQQFLQGVPASSLEVNDWSTHHWLHFLRHLPEELPTAQQADLDGSYQFSATGNSEILFEWLIHAIAWDYEEADPALERFLTQQGRRKFLKPLYKKLAATEKGLAKARQIYAKARPGYHSVSAQTIDAILQ